MLQDVGVLVRGCAKGPPNEMKRHVLYTRGRRDLVDLKCSPPRITHHRLRVSAGHCA